MRGSSVSETTRESATGVELLRPAPAGKPAAQAHRVWLGFALTLMTGAALAAPQDFDFRVGCESQAHVFNAKAGEAFDARIRVLNGNGDLVFCGFDTVPIAGPAPLRCSEVTPGAVFRCGDLTIALPAGSPDKSLPEREFARISGTPATKGDIRFRLRVQADKDKGIICERRYSMTIRPAVEDTVAPSVPGEFVAEVRLPSPTIIVDLRWQAATDNVRVTGYQIQRCAGEMCPQFQVLASIPPGTRFTDRHLLREDTAYQYRIRAFDDAGNFSDFSRMPQVQTPFVGGSTTHPTSKPLPQ